MKKFLLASAAAIAFASGAQAADLGVARVPVAAAVIAPAFGWTGFYIGLNAGLGIANTNLSALSNGFVPGSGSGFVGGLQLGYNYQINNLVLGVEGDIGYFGVSRSVSETVGATTATLRWRTQWDGSLRARLGVAADRTLFYVTGGVAFADFNLSVSAANARLNNAVAVGETQTRVGWTVGAGIEHAITPNWTVRGEYLYSDYGSRTFFNGLTAPVRLQTHKFRIGVNYLFSTGPSAIVARY